MNGSGRWDYAKPFTSHRWNSTCHTWRTSRHATVMWSIWWRPPCRLQGALWNPGCIELRVDIFESQPQAKTVRYHKIFVYIRILWISEWKVCNYDRSLRCVSSKLRKHIGGIITLRKCYEVTHCGVAWIFKGLLIFYLDVDDVNDGWSAISIAITN